MSAGHRRLIARKWTYPNLWGSPGHDVDEVFGTHRIVAGREETWIGGFIDWIEQVKGGVGEEAIAEYAESLRRPGHLRASFQYFRAFHGDVADTIANRATTLTMPVPALGGEGAIGQVVADQAKAYASDVTGAVLPCGHWIAEEIPDILTEQLLAFLR